MSRIEDLEKELERLEAESFRGYTDRAERSNLYKKIQEIREELPRLKREWLLGLIASGEAVELKVVWIKFLNGYEWGLLFDASSLKALLDTFGCDDKQMRFIVWSYEDWSKRDIWLRSDMLCSIMQWSRDIYALVDGKVVCVLD